MCVFLRKKNITSLDGCLTVCKKVSFSFILFFFFLLVPLYPSLHVRVYVYAYENRTWMMTEKNKLIDWQISVLF
jgi:hypothetical protein